MFFHVVDTFLCRSFEILRSHQNISPVKRNLESLSIPKRLLCYYPKHYTKGRSFTFAIHLPLLCLLLNARVIQSALGLLFQRMQSYRSNFQKAPLLSTIQLTPKHIPVKPSPPAWRGGPAVPPGRKAQVKGGFES